jgi:hypothetical protein
MDGRKTDITARAALDEFGNAPNSRVVVADVDV